MPYRSKAQVRFMHARHPQIAARWDKEYGVPKDLPDHVREQVERAKRAHRRVKQRRG